MNSRDACLLALRSMRVARLRTTLTTIGIAVGVAAVIVLAGLGDGLKTRFTESLGSYSTSIFLSQSFGSQVPGGALRVLRDGDAAALADPSLAPHIRGVTPIFSGSGVVRYNRGVYNAQLAASTTDYLDVYNRRLAAGSMFTEAQNVGGARVVLLGPGIVDALFHGDPKAALGSSVQIGRLAFTVIGVVAPSGESEDLAVVPLAAARILFGRGDVLSQVALRATSVEDVPRTIDEINAVMDERHNIRNPGLRDFAVSATLTQVRRTNDFLDSLTLFALSVAGIALLVGGLGVANIMLVTVTERTREIGIRKAIGARRTAIGQQFLIEATTLSGVGGLLGVALGIALTLAGARLLPEIAPTYGTPTPSPFAIATAFGVSLLVGVLAGGYPALRAARLRPVEALRH
ncbi:ABC transporter permease [Pseudonocardia spinosispora]|uniref:ABC transporter permease n=1 Tax=Pseudonocardia spinosispora TaxID=103441 RepID=UPI0004068144|nr:ABC transporter permease [Pseudonocardia spinosispora]